MGNPCNVLISLIFCPSRIFFFHFWSLLTGQFLKGSFPISFSVQIQPSRLHFSLTYFGTTQTILCSHLDLQFTESTILSIGITTLCPQFPLIRLRFYLYHDNALNYLSCSPSISLTCQKAKHTYSYLFISCLHQ